MTPAEIAKAQRLCEAATPEPWVREGRTIYALMHAGWRKGVEQFKNRFYCGIYGDSECGEDELEANVKLMQSVRSLLPKALAHIQAQAEQLRQLQAEGIIMREALLDVDAVHQSAVGRANERGDNLVIGEMWRRVISALSFASTITAYAARVARMEESLRELQAHFVIGPDLPDNYEFTVTMTAGELRRLQAAMVDARGAALEGDG